METFLSIITSVTKCLTMTLRLLLCGGSLLSEGETGPLHHPYIRGIAKQRRLGNCQFAQFMNLLS